MQPVLLGGTMRRTVTFLFIVGIVVGAVWTLLRWNGVRSALVDPWRAIPERTALVISVPDAFMTWDRFTHTAQLWKAIATLPGAAATDGLIARTVVRMENDEALRQALRNSSVLVAVMRHGGDALGCLFVGTPANADGAPLRAFGELLGLDATAYAALGRGDVVQVRPDTALATLSFCIRQGVWLLATDPSMMDEALLQWKKGSSLKDDTAFTAAFSTLGAGSDAHVLLRPDRLLDLAQMAWSPEALDFPEVSGQWLAMDLRSRSDALLMSGLLLGPPSGPHAIALHGQDRGPMDGARVLPGSVTGYRTWNVSDITRWLADRKAMTDSVWVTDLLGWARGTVGVAHTSDSSTNQWAYFAAPDVDAAEGALRSLCAAGCDTSGYRGLKLQRLPLTGMHEKVLGEAFSGLGRAWWVVLGDAVVFGTTTVELERSIDAWLDGRSLAEDARTSDWWVRMASNAGSTWWCDIARAQPWKSKSLLEAARQHVDLWSALGGFTVHLSPGQRGSTHVTVGLQYAPIKEIAGPERWVVELGAPVSGTPQEVIDHTNGTRQILVQDDLFTLHLIGSTGELMWSRPMDGPILGGVRQVDRFRNGKLQLLFNTSEKVHLIDRNGKDVGGFPVELESRSATPLSVFDYEGNGELRVLVPTQSGTIINIGMDGSPVNGWSAPRLKAPAATKVDHLRIRNKDHLIAVDTLGHVHILDRKGADRERPRLELGVSPSVLGIVPGSTIGTCSVLWQGSDGGLYKGTLEGKAELLFPGRGGRFTGAWFASNGAVMHTEVNKDTLWVREGSKVVAQHVLSGIGIPGTQHTVSSGEEQVLGIATQRGSLHLFDGDGQALSGTPVVGAGPWVLSDLDRDGTRELVTVSSNGIVKCLPFPPVP